MTTLTASPSPALTVHLGGIVDLDDAQLFELCQRNRDLRIERNATGELIFMPPAGGRTSNRNIRIAAQLAHWSERDGTGQAFDSSGGFVLPDGAMRSPDAAWVEKVRLDRLTSEERDRFLPLCPTFVIELRSPSDSLPPLQAKMREYVENGTRLAWLVDPKEQRVHVYRPSAEIETLDKPASVAGDPELPGFVLEMTGIWDPSW